MDMARLARPVGRPARHEGRHQAALLRHDLGKGLEQHGLVGGGEGTIDLDRGFEHARPRFLVQAFQGHVHLDAAVEDVAVEVAVDRGAQHGIAEEARLDRLEVAVVLFAHRLRRFLEHEEFVFQAGQHLEAHLVGLGQGPAQHGAGADLFILAVEFAEEEQHVVLPGDLAAAFGQDAHGGVGIARVPAGDGNVVVQLVLGIPAQHHVAEAEALIEGGDELVGLHVLAAHDAVHVDDADLDVVAFALGDDLLGVRRRLDLSRFHLPVPLPLE